jgi:hypothetical protein
MTRNSRKLLCCAAGAAVLLLAVGATQPAAARPGDPSLPCQAFSRNTFGSWIVLAPVMLDVGGMLYSPTVGTTFAAGSMRNGIAMTDVLDRECGNR